MHKIYLLAEPPQMPIVWLQTKANQLPLHSFFTIMSLHIRRGYSYNLDTQDEAEEKDLLTEVGEISSRQERIVDRARDFSTTKSRHWMVLALGFSLLCNSVYFIHSMMGRTVTEQQGWVRPDVVYGLVHMAKTAGTEINGELSNHFERVCGNKGWSYDALEANRRFRETHKTGKVNRLNTVKDSITKLYHGGNRGSTPPDWMEEIGFDDCDYIALETKAPTWIHFAKTQKMELHIPCREPLNHIMSQCNHHGRSFNCSNPNIDEELDKCQIGLHSRFKSYLPEKPNIVTKCFDPMPPARYVKYMGTILQPKRIESDYVHRDSNAKRDRESECIWHQSDEYKENFRQRLLDNFPYYRFCDDCMGSNMELPLGD